VMGGGVFCCWIGAVFGADWWSLLGLSSTILVNVMLPAWSGEAAGDRL
jgi:hypothetical protein